MTAPRPVRARARRRAVHFRLRAETMNEKQTRALLSIYTPQTGAQGEHRAAHISLQLTRLHRPAAAVDGVLPPPNCPYQYTTIRPGA